MAITRVSVCVSLPLVRKGNWIQRLTIRDPEKISVCMCGFSTGATSRMATSQFAVWVAAFGLFLMLQTCWTQQGYAFYAIIFSYGVDTACFGYAECVIDKLVSQLQSYSSSVSLQYRTCARSWWRRRCRYRVYKLKKYDRIIDGALFLLQHKISYRLCCSLPNDVLFTVCLLFWIHTKFHTMLT